MQDIPINFLVVGAAKSGTTSLYYYLKEHPDVFLPPVKEPLFFSTWGLDKQEIKKELYPVPFQKVVSDKNSYIKLFSKRKNEKAVGEASVYYLPDHVKTIANIRKLIPEPEKLKIIIILRDPVEASYSNYLMYTLYLKHHLGQKKTLSFIQSLDAEDERLKNGYRALAHFHWFFYHDQVKAYLDNFNQVKIFLFSELRENPQKLTKDLFDFLEIDSSFSPERTGSQYNASGVPKNALLYKLLMTSAGFRTIVRPITNMPFIKEKKDLLLNNLVKKNIKKPSMGNDMRVKLQLMYHDDILRLQSLIRKDLTSWLA